MAEHEPISVAGLSVSGRPRVSTAKDRRLRKHADYQRVYRDSRKHFSASMSYFYALRPVAEPAPTGPTASSPLVPAIGPRVGLTAGRVLGKAVDRNRIKRRMREAVCRHIAKLTANVDVVLHPRKTVVAIEYAKLESEVGRIFTIVDAATSKPSGTKAASSGQPTDDAASRSARPASRSAKPARAKA